MANPQESWKDVADKVESLGLKLKLHLEEELDDEVDEKNPGDTRSAFDDLGDKLGSAFEAFGDAAKDEAVHADVKAIAELIKEALIKTFRAAGAELSEVIDKIEDFADRAADEIGDALGLDGADDDVIEVAGSDTNAELGEVINPDA